MQTYLESLLFSQQNNIPTTEQIDKVLHDLQNDNSQIEKELEQYELKIAQLPLEIRRKIQLQQYLPEELSKRTIGDKRSEDISSPHSSNIFSSILDKSLLEQKLKNLEQEEEQIEYISRLSDIYIRCKKQPQSLIPLDQKGFDDKEQQNHLNKLNSHKSTLERQELQEMAQFIKSIKPYSISEDSQNIDSAQSYHLINDLISNMKIHTSKKLTEKCENLVHYGPSGNNDKIIIQTFLIKNCKSIILGEETKSELEREAKQNKSEKILSKFIEKILGDVIYYDVSYQKIISMSVIDSQIPSSNPHLQTIHRKKVYFFPSQTQKHFQQIKSTISLHIQKAQQLKTLFSPNHSPNFQLTFDRILQRQVSLIKSNLEYILPYINIKSRKVLMAILADGKDEVIDFEDLVLRLKFKGQDGEMFMNNLDAVFGRLLDMTQSQNLEGESQQKELIRFNDKNFQTLTNFFELGIFQAQQSLLQTSSKAIKKLTTNLASLHNRQKPSLPTKHTSKKLFNMIFFSVSNLIERFDQLLDKEGEKFCQYSRNLGIMYDEKVALWVDKLIEIRENVRRRIHEE